MKIKCEISEEEAHGRFYMKINMFDISLLLNRVIQKQGLPFLFHDGSYSKPAKNNKEQLLRIVDDYLKQHQYGQYFVTVNVEELSKSFLEEENTKKCIVAKLQRESTNKDRFIGLKY